MSADNIEVTFRMPISVDKPDLNGFIYSKDAIKNAYKNVKNVPIEIPNDKGKFLPIGVCQEAELIEDENGMHIKGVGIIWHGDTEETIGIEDNKVTSFNVTGIGFAKE